MGFLMERRSPTKSYAAHVSLGDYIIMTQDVRKYPKVEKHFIPAIIAPDFQPVWNRQPPVVSDKPLRRMIRNRIRPFTPESEEVLRPKMTPTVVNPAANMRKVIDFALASLRESDKRYHCQVMFEMCERLAGCWNCSNSITPEQLYILYEIHAWACPKTGTKHSIRTPLSLEFKTHIWQGGRLAISNAIPVYNGNLPGEYHWVGLPEYSQALSA